MDRLIISIDGTTQDVYQQYRVGGHLDKVLDGARNVVKWKKELKSKTPFIIFQFLVVKPNEHQIDEVKKIAKDIGVDDVWFKTAQIYDYENANKTPEQRQLEQQAPPGVRENRQVSPEDARAALPPRLEALPVFPPEEVLLRLLGQVLPLEV